MNCAQDFNSHDFIKTEEYGGKENLSCTKCSHKIWVVRGTYEEWLRKKKGIITQFLLFDPLESISLPVQTEEIVAPSFQEEIELDSIQIPQKKISEYSNIPNYSIYMGMINGYAITKLTLDSFFDSGPSNFNQFFLVADGTTDLRLLELLLRIKQTGYNNISREKFQIIYFLKNRGVAASINLVISLMNKKDDLLYLHNNTLFCDQFVQLMRIWAYLYPVSKDVYIVAPTIRLPFASDNDNAQFDYLAQENIGKLNSEEFLILVNQFMLKSTGQNVRERLKNLSLKNEGCLTTGDANEFQYIKRECLNHVGYFDEAFSHDEQGNKFCGVGEDWDYSTRVMNYGKTIVRGHDISFLPIVRHFTTKTRSAEEIEKSLKQFYQKYNQNRTLIRDGYVLVGNQRIPQHHSVLDYLKAPRSFVELV